MQPTDAWIPHLSARARSFGAIATAYERYRRDYPDRLVDEIVTYAGRPVRTALEIGAGTGKATRVLVRHGVAVTAVEPDPAMVAELIQHVPSGVTPVNSTFEDVPANRTFDLVYAAAALHWTASNGRWERVAALLPSGGVFASIGGPMAIADPELAEAARAARSHVLPDDDVPPPDGTPPEDPRRWPGTELERSPLFTDIGKISLEQRFRMPAEDYVGHLGTVSAYLMLSDEQRRDVLRRIRDVLPAHVDIRADLDLHLARRV